MMKSPLFFLRARSWASLLIASFACVSLQAKERDWTNRDGLTISAELIAVEGEQITLKMNGRNFQIPLATLSNHDQSYVKNWQPSPSATQAEDASEVKPNWDADWPRLISVPVDQPIETVKEDDQTGEFIYTSPHFEFVSDVKLNTSVVRRFALLFEATTQYCRELPLGMVKPFQKKRHLIQLFELENTYRMAGGPPNSAGVYVRRGDTESILVPLTSLGVKKVGSNYAIDHDVDNKVVAHEIVHILTDSVYYRPGARGWFSEGLAEYVALSGYRSGKYSSQDLGKIKEYVTAYGEGGQGGRALGTEFVAPDLKTFMTMPYENFLSSDGNLNYGLSLLLAYYFFHMDGDKDASRIKAFLKGMKEGNEGEAVFAPLLDGRTWEEMEQEVVRNWRSRGIRISFQKI